jgi:hypothetical protein
MSKLRASARGQECLVRIPGVCNRNPETVVLAHLNGGGMGMKTHDIHGSYCCSSCHDMLDGRVSRSSHEYTGPELKLMHYEGIKRTQDYWLSIGMVITK